jgi:hypothetical protein
MFPAINLHCSSFFVGGFLHGHDDTRGYGGSNPGKAKAAKVLVALHCHRISRAKAAQSCKEESENHKASLE